LHLHTYFFTGEDMTQDEVLKMARRAGYFIYDLTETHKKKTVETDEADEWAQLERFAKLVAQHEREACAKECEHTALRMGSEWMAQHCAQAIRARGDNK
jgi:hypothetical protein